MRMKTDTEYWESVKPLISEFMETTYQPCEGWKCGVTARYVLVRFKKYVGRDGGISYHSFYNELRRLGYNLPVVKGFERKTKITGISLKDGYAPY